MSESSDLQKPGNGQAHAREPGKGRVLVFLVAYEAESHTRAVFDRIPTSLLNNDRVQFVLIDDASSDASAACARQWVQEHHVQNITILRNPVNQRYGGNQKLGYRIGIEAGFDFIILLHGDGQYAPELLTRFIEIWEETDADVILGSRMQDVASARRGGMPWYKVLGNRTLTVVQNFLTGQHLSEYHTGYRGYSTRFLRRVPFEINTDEFHFDTEILLQAVHVGAKIVEFPIPTRYGDEICRVNGMRYAKDVLVSTMQFKLHQMGILCALKYRNLDVTRYRDKAHVLYSSHTMALEIVKKNAPKTLLDLGCGPGYIARYCRAMGVEVTGVDAYEPIAGMMDHFYRADLESDRLPVDAFKYDMVLLLDVLEHMRDPETFLVDLRNRSEGIRGGKLAPLMVISTPNIAFAAVRLNLLLGRFSYAERGILDITHKRLFTRSTLLRMIRDCGYTLESVKPIGAPLQVVMAGRMGRILGTIMMGLARLWPTMFAFQFLVTCRPRPGIRQLLSESEQHLVASAEVQNILIREQPVPEQIKS